MIKYNLSGTWHTIKNVYTKVNGTWKTVGQISIKVNNTWHKIWSYSWKTGNWGNCSASCGGGTQTRSVTCKRNDAHTVADSLCTKYVGSKPATSKRCNTHACTVCHYALPRYWDDIYGAYFWSIGPSYHKELWAVWDRTQIYKAETSNPWTTYTSNGYIYSRGNYIENKPVGGYSRDFYQLCRKPV